MWVYQAHNLSYKFLFSVSFKIYSDAIKKLIHHLNRFGGNITIGYKSVEKSFFSSQNTTVSGIFKKYAWLIVGVRYAVTAIKQRLFDYFFRRNVSSLNLSSLAKIKVYTIFAKPVAPSCTNRKNLSSGHKMSYRLFFNWVYVTRCNLAIYIKNKFSFFITTYSTKPYLVFSNFTIPSTG